MLPSRGQSLSHWKLSPDDFRYLIDQKGNGLNLIGLSYSWFRLLQDSPIADDKPYSVAAKFYRRLSDPVELPRMIKEFAGLMDRLLAEPRVRKDGGLDTPHLFREFAKTPVFREFHYWVRTKDPLTYSFLHSFLDFGRKAEYVNPELQGEALNAWLDIEDHLRRLKLPDHVVEDIRRLIALSGLEYDPTFLYPKHGPRQVAEGLDEVTPHGKNNAMGINSEIQTFLDMLVYHHASGEEAPGVWYTLPDTQMLYTFLSEQLVAQLGFVIKDIKSMRSICMEQAVLMWAQQGLLRALKVGMGRSKFAAVIDIDNQDANVAACLRASYDRLMSTIDLSSASDLLSWELVQRVFPESLVQLFGITRSKLVRMPLQDEQGDIIVEVKKFAPMGSALCFIVQCILFAAVVALAKVIHSRRLSVGVYLSEGMSVVTSFPEYDVDTCVYGDDIIVPVSYTADVMILLQSLGFKVNERKSFTGTQAVRESCGAFGLLGYDIAGLKFKVRNLNSGSYDSWLGLINLANRASDRGYYNLRDGLRELLPYNTYAIIPRESPYSKQSFALHAIPGEISAAPDELRFPSEYYTGTELFTDERWDPVIGRLPSDRWNASKCRWERKLLVARSEPLGYRDELVPIDYGDPDKTDDDSQPTWRGSKHDPIRDGYGRPFPRIDTVADLEIYHLGQYLYEHCHVNQKEIERRNTPLALRLSHMAPQQKLPPRTGLEVPATVRLRWVPVE